MERPSSLVSHGLGLFFITKQVMATHYEDAVLHLLGGQRTREWYQNVTAPPDRTGCALAFWYQLDESAELRLPDGIVAGLRSLELAEFEAVYCMTYGQVFPNMPKFVKIIDANRVLPEPKFKQCLRSGGAGCTGFIAVLASWLREVGAGSFVRSRRTLP